MTKLEICNRALTRCGAEPITNLTDQNKRALLVTAQYEATLREILNDTTWNFATARTELVQSTAPSFGFAWSYTIPDAVIRVIETNVQDPFRVEGRKLLTNYDAKTLSCSITRVGSVATVVATAHGYTTGNDVFISGATQTEYNGKHTSITVIDADTFTFTVSGAPATPATGTPLVALDSAILRIKYLEYVTDTTLWSPSFIKAFYLKLAEDMAYSLVQSASLQQAIISEAERYLRRARSYNSQEGTPESRYPEDYTSSLRL